MKEFIKPWMKKCNPDLILRFWRHKGSPGILTIERYGMTFRYTRTIFGELMYKWWPGPLTEMLKKDSEFSWWND